MVVNESDVRIRSAEVQDAEDLKRLCGQLGYEVDLSSICSTLRGMESDPTHEVLVASIGTQVVGWIELTFANYLTSGQEAQICGLVVDEAHRSKGIGKELVKSAEDWARRAGHGAIRVRSRDTRERAHKFYLNLGYELYKKQLVFRKNL